MRLKSILHEIITPKDNYLYHASPIENFEEIKKHGLLPSFGDLVKSTEGWHHWKRIVQNHSSPWNEVDEIEGVIFFSEEPQVGFFDVSKDVDKETLLNDVFLCIVEKNETIYKKKGMGQVVNSRGENVNVVEFGRRMQYQVETDKIPPFIERGDWFSFNAQDPIKILYGEELFEFLETHYPDKI